MKFIKTKKGIFYGVVFLLMITLGVSYGTFVFVSNPYKSSNMLISNLLYGVSIQEEGSTSKIDNNKVTIPAKTKGYFYVTISSVNKIDSKYTLAYKSTNTVNVKYTDRTNWNPEGLIKGYDETTYSKKVKVVVDNTSNTSSTEVTFGVFGGYTYNSYEAISLENGYLTINGPYTEVIHGTNRLVDIVEKDTSCITEENKTCMYGGETISNYLQYPANDDVTKNLWRIIGTYNIDGEVVTKVISITNGITTQSTLMTDLISFYNTLEDKEKYVYNTNKFNCDTKCNTSSFTNIGILNKYEYDVIDGDNSYLKEYVPFYILNNGEIENLYSTETSSNLRGNIYFQTDVKVTGSGTKTDPYKVSKGQDVNLVAYTLNGESTTKTYEWLKTNNAINGISCENGSVAEWDYDKNGIYFSKVNVPDYCTVDFGDGYTVTLKAINGTVTSATSISVGENGTALFTITPNSGYTLDGSTVTCTGSGLADITTSGVKVSNVKSSQTCIITLDKIGTSLANHIINTYTTNNAVGTRTSFSSAFTEKNDKIYSTNRTEDGSTVYYYAGNTTNNWVKFGKYTKTVVRGYDSSSTTTTLRYKEFSSMSDCTNDAYYKYNCEYAWSAGDDMYWRIIRTNEDGSVRLLYAGNGPDTRNGYISPSLLYNINVSTSHMGVGYMYGEITSSGSGNYSLEKLRANTNPSTVKIAVDKWYVDNILDSYGKYVSKTAIYCNDKSIYYSGSSSLVPSISSGSSTIFGSYTRITTDNYLTYKCGSNSSGVLNVTASDADKFNASKDDKYKNYGKLNCSINGYMNEDCPVALMTGDELAFAGANINSVNASAWYAVNSKDKSVTNSNVWLTMTPASFNGNSNGTGSPGVLGATGDGRLAGSQTNVNSIIRPVLSLKACVKYSKGDGTSSNPYEVSINDVCANAEN